MEWGQIILLSIWLLLMVDVCRTAGMEPSLKIMSRRKVLVISLDGFGHHYLDKYPWRYLATNLYSAGSYPRKFRNQFVTKTFPNHFSVATGLYEEVHGVIGNNIYDSSLNKTFGMDDKELFMQNPLVSPVWIDEGIGYLYQMLTVHKLRDTVDVIVMSDHGMSAVKEENVIFLDDIVDSSLYHISGTSPLLNVWTTFEKQLEVYSSLLEGSRTHNYTVYLKEDPQFLAWHYSKNTRISQISILAAEGYVFKDFKNYIDYMKKKGATDLTDTHGNHGYPVDIPNMEPIFVAAGPSFKRGFKAPDFSNIDTYMLLCHLLNLAPGPNNGTADNISSILVEPISSTLIRPLSVTLEKPCVDRGGNHYKM
ncbi:hypothetical protein OTU49_011424 [Cherax quadricarinatus]|uniref:Uncharacterized protein n=1 Tax=Cherax quadricarinatus TaxID=27406 RepID=A0AAW0W5E4_CHEQU